MQLLGHAGVLPEVCRKPVLVMGCGNPLFGDDGFGPAVIAHLEETLPARLRDRVCLHDAGTGARSVLFTLVLGDERPEHVIVVDAVDVGRRPGEVFSLPIAALPVAKVDDFSMHQAPSSNLLRELAAVHGLQVEVVACQVGGLPDHVAPGLCDAVRAAIPDVTRIVLKKVSSHEPAKPEHRPRQRGDPPPPRRERPQAHG